jgi:subtilisin family serine protease
MSLFVVIPNTNVWNSGAPGGSQLFMRAASRQLRGRRHGLEASASTELQLTLVDQVAASDTLLISMPVGRRVDLLRLHPGLSVVPVESMRPLWMRRLKLQQVLGPAAGAKRALEVSVTDSVSGAALRNVEVIGFSDRAGRVGASNKTNSSGLARLMFSANLQVLESVEAQVPSGYWPAYARDVALADGSLNLQCTPIDMAVQDVRGHLGFFGQDADGAGVRVGMVDSGVAVHPDLQFMGRNVVKGEDATDLRDVLGHGTHVAGIISGRGRPGVGARGVAPGADLRVYRVFADGQDEALSFNIAKGIRQAVEDRCDLINLSIGGEQEVPDVLREIQRARALGVVCIAAAGNDFRSTPNYPARYPAALAVSAFGTTGTFPKEAAEELEVVEPFGADKNNFIAGFSNVGIELDLVGPGVGIISSYPEGYAVMDGTSMACPVITGALARLLSRKPQILSMDRVQARSDAILELALNAASSNSLGFDAVFQGAGLLA